MYLNTIRPNIMFVITIFTRFTHYDIEVYSQSAK